MKKLSIKNFRIFKKDGVDIDLAPITMLTGCNSSGKTTITKSILALDDYLMKINDAFKLNGSLVLGKYNIDLQSKQLNLGKFQDVVNRFSDTPEFSFGYDVTPDCSLLPYHIELSFSRRNNDFLNNAWVKKVVIKNYKNDVFIDCDVTDTEEIVFKKISLDAVLNGFFRFIDKYRFFYLSNKLKGLYELKEEGEYHADEIETLERKLDEIKDQSYYASEKSYGRLVKRDVMDKYKVLLDQDLQDLASKTIEEGILFYFPLFEELKDKSKTEQIDILKQARYEDFYCTMNFNDVQEKVIKNFKNSSFDSFPDYFRSLEDIELKNSIPESRQFTVSNICKDLMTMLEYRLAVSYKANEGIHSFGNANNKDFEYAYLFLSAWQWAISDKDDYIERVKNTIYFKSEHKLYVALLEYAKLIAESMFNTDYIGDFSYIGNFHSEVMRMYSFDNTDSNMVKCLKKYLVSQRKLQALSEQAWGTGIEKYKCGEFINKWIKKLRIGNSLNIIYDEDDSGVKLFLRKDSNRKGYPLADEGAGISQIVTFLLNIEVAIIESKIQEYEDASEFIWENYKPAPKERTLILEEPEIGLHPSFQSTLLDIFYDAYTRFKLRFIIETHSEYMIRRSQAIVANFKSDKEFQENPFRVYYVNPETGIYDLEYTETGRFNQPFGPGFFDESSRSNLEILKRERRGK